MARTFMCCDMCGTRVGEVLPDGIEKGIHRVKLVEWDNCTTVVIGSSEHYRCKACWEVTNGATGNNHKNMDV